jgi:hypothetical protein
MIRLTPKDIVLEQYQISCGNFIAETKKYVYLNDIAIDSLNPRYDLHNNNGGHVKNVKNVEKSIKITKIQSLYGCLILLLSGDVSINPGPIKFSLWNLEVCRDYNTNCLMMLKVYCILTQVGRYILCGTIVCNLHTKYLFGFFLTAKLPV